MRARVLLRRALRVQWRLRLRQAFDCRPQLIDQDPAVADLFPLFDTGQSIPQDQQPGFEGAGAPAIVEGILDLLAGGEGTADAERWAQVCTNSGKCIPACDYGVNPRFMVNMARVVAKEKLGEAEVRRAAHQYFTTMSRGTRVISRLQLAPEVLARINPPLRAADEYSKASVIGAKRPQFPGVCATTSTNAALISALV